ncbi:MAG: C4-dicarboxylate transporter DcuC [Plesiomonas shigelloides]
MVALISLVVILVTGYLIVKKYNPQMVLFIAGIVLLASAILLGVGTPLPEAKSSGSVWLDIFTYIKGMMGSTVADLGLIIMAVGGFAKYMDHIGASRALVAISTRPLSVIRNPYLVMAMGYILGQLLNIFIPSAAGLGLLLMVTMYPIMTSLGVSRMSAAAIIATTACLDLGPASGNVNLAAKIADMPVTEYFLSYQGPVAIASMITIAVLHMVVQRWFDLREAKNPVAYEATEEDTKELVTPPLWYALFPMIPLVLIFTFSKMVITTVKIDVVTAMLISFAVAMAVESIRFGGNKVFKDILVFFDAMGKAFARVVSLIIAGQTLAHGLKAIGILDMVIHGAIASNISPVYLVVLMVIIITVAAFLMGSGNAPFFSFAAMVPDIAAKVGISSASMLLPMQLAAGLGRTISPITGVIVAVAGAAGVSPFDLVKRTAIPMLGALLVSTVYSLVFYV